MEVVNLELLKQQVRSAGPITGFCYPYAKLLLLKMESLLDNGAGFDERGRVTMEMEVLTSGLSGQVRGEYDYSIRSRADAVQMIAQVKQHLAIFE